MLTRSASQDQLAAPAASELVNLVVVLADNRYFLGRRVSEWIIKAPALEQGVACAAIAGEEMGAARVLYGLLERLPVAVRPTPLVTGSDRERTYNLSFLDRSFPSWAHVVAALNLVDPALTVVCQALVGSTYAPVAQRAARILDEERFHEKFAAGRLHDAAAYPFEKARVQAIINEWWPEAVMWFGRDRATRWPELGDAGILPRDGEHLTVTYQTTVQARFEAAGFTVPSQEALPWSDWDVHLRRIDRKRAPTAGD